MEGFYTTPADYDSDNFLVGGNSEMSPPQSKSPLHPSLWRLLMLNLPEWPYALLGSLGASMAGCATPLFAFGTSDTVVAFYNGDHEFIRSEVRKVCIIFSVAIVVAILVCLLQHYFFGLMGEHLTQRVRRMMFACKYTLPFQIASLLIKVIINSKGMTGARNADVFPRWSLKIMADRG